MTVGVDEHPRIPAPGCGRPRAADRRAGRARLGKDRVDLLGGAYVVGQGDASPAAWVLDGRVFGEGRTAPQSDHHAAALEEDDAVCRNRGARPPERLVEATRTVEVGDTESDKAHTLVHGTVPRSIGDDGWWSGGEWNACRP